MVLFSLVPWNPRLGALGVFVLRSIGGTRAHLASLSVSRGMGAAPQVVDVGTNFSQMAILGTGAGKKGRELGRAMFCSSQSPVREFKGSR